jgi:hypothetical protein
MLPVLLLNQSHVQVKAVTERIWKDATAEEILLRVQKQDRQLLLQDFTTRIANKVNIAECAAFVAVLCDDISVHTEEPLGAVIDAIPMVLENRAIAQRLQQLLS